MPTIQQQRLTLPNKLFLLVETNLPADQVKSLIGQSVAVDILPEELPATRKVDPSDVPLWIDPKGNYWNDYRPIRVLYTDPEGRVWRFPRKWLHNQPSGPEVDCLVEGEGTFTEKLHLPSAWDVWELNIPWTEANRGEGRETEVCVSVTPKEPPKVVWRDSTGRAWRIPHDWRRRRIQLPSPDILTSQGVPPDVAAAYGNKIVSVNYHPFSFCCLPDQYRFRDEDGNRWPVRMADCVLLGYGTQTEHQA